MHMTQHQVDSNVHQFSLESALEASSRPVTEIAASSCPLCDYWGDRVKLEVREEKVDISSIEEILVPVKQFQRHLGSHLEQLALFAITPESNFEKDQDSGTDKDSRSSKASKGGRERVSLSGSAHVDEVCIITSHGKSSEYQQFHCTS